MDSGLVIIVPLALLEQYDDVFTLFSHVAGILKANYLKFPVSKN